MQDRKEDVTASKASKPAKQRGGSGAGSRSLAPGPEAAAGVAAQLGGNALSPAGALALQRSAGNAAAARVIAAQRHAHGPSCGHQEAAPEQDAPSVQRRSAVHDVLRTAGQPLPGPVQTDMEARFGGADFSDVRIHTDAAARQSAQEIGARAYTSGSHIVMGEGGGDRHTLAHELTHVIQQRQGPVAGTDNGDGLSVSDPSDRYEVAAEETARQVLSGDAPAAGHAVQRTADPSHADAAPVQRMYRPTAAADRPSRRQAVRVRDLPHYISDPTYTRATRREAGGEMSRATLGPNSYFGMGTDADSRLPPAIDDARAAYGIPFIAGHLLNADFGGHGRTSANLTILTPRANSAMKRFDDPVKQAVYYLKDIYELLSRLYVPIDRLQYGIAVKIGVSGPSHVWDRRYPGNCISQYITCDARLRRESDVDVYYDRRDPHDRQTEAVWRDVRRLMAAVRSLVDQANEHDLIDNEQ